MGRVMVHVSTRGNAFMNDIAAAVAQAARALGHEVPEVSSALPEEDGAVHLVIAPHEFFRLSDEPVSRLRRALASSVLVSTEQPGTPWFDYTVGLCRGARAVLDINSVAAERLRAAGIDAEYLRLGAVPTMDATARVPVKDIDVVFLGALDRRRAAILSSLAPVLDDWSTELRLFPFDQPVGGGSPGLVFGPAKYELLARSKILLNIHRDGHDARRPYFEWARMVEAMANGCVVVTEPSSGVEPLVPGVHVVEADPASVAATLTELLHDDARRTNVALAARTSVLGDLGLASSLGPALERIAHTPQQRVRHIRSAVFGGATAPPARSAFTPHLELQRSAKALVRRHDQMLRDLDRVEAELHGQRVDDVVIDRSPAWAGATPDLSVVVTLYNYAHLVTETLDSVLSSEGVRPEIIVVDDASTDQGRDVVLRHLSARADVPWSVVSRVCNGGLSAARNLAFEHARCEPVLVIDADNLVHRHGIAKLLRTLEAAPDAAGAYGILEDFGEQRALRSAFDWDVRRLCATNYIDAQSLLRRSAWAEVGGYRDNDDEVYGWEDWDLWLRFAAAGRRLAFCPQIVGRYRTQAQSMVSLANIAADDMRAAIRRRYPSLPWGVDT